MEEVGRKRNEDEEMEGGGEGSRRKEIKQGGDEEGGDGGRGREINHEGEAEGGVIQSYRRNWNVWTKKMKRQPYRRNWNVWT